MMYWLKGFAIGGAIVISSLSGVFILTFSFLMMTGILVDKSEMFNAFLIFWIFSVGYLIFKGYAFSEISGKGVIVRSLFFWLPITIGYMLMPHTSGKSFVLGLMISSTLVGYSVVVTLHKKHHNNQTES